MPFDGKDIAYLDNAATTRPLPQVVDRMNDVLAHAWGNPSATYELGRRAKSVLEGARATLAEAMGVDADEVYFTSGATESNNLAIRGACFARRAAAVVQEGSASSVGRRDMRAAEPEQIVTSALEHASVTRTVRGLRREGWPVAYIDDIAGGFDMGALTEALERPTALVTAMFVQNELGWILPVADIAAARDALCPQALVHTDATQAFGKLPLNLRTLGVDLATVGAHKIGGPRGIGALYVKRGTPMFTTAFGGGQERGLRGGTEAVYLAAGFAEAARIAVSSLDENLAHARMLKARLLEGMRTAVPSTVVNSRDDGSPYIVSLSVPGMDAQAAVDALSERGVYVSRASACTNNHASVPAGTWRPKHPLSLQAAGVSAELGRSTLRVSFCAQTRERDIDRFLAELSSFLAR